MCLLRMMSPQASSHNALITFNNKGEAYSPFNFFAMKFFLSCIMVLLCAGVFAQTSTLPLRADTVDIFKVGGAAELKLRNATRDSLYGLLQNIGGGKTRFIVPRMLNDTTLVIGGQTLKIRGSGSGGGGITALTGDVTASGPGSAAATIASHAVSNAKFRQSAANKLVGNPTGSTADVTDIGLGRGLQFSTGNLVDTLNHLSDFINDIGAGGGGIPSLNQVTQSGNISANSLRIAYGSDTTQYAGAFGAGLDLLSNQGGLQLADGSGGTFPANLTNYFVDSIVYRGNTYHLPTTISGSGDTIAVLADVRAGGANMSNADLISNGDHIVNYNQHYWYLDNATVIQLNTESSTGDTVSKVTINSYPGGEPQFDLTASKQSSSKYAIIHGQPNGGIFLGTSDGTNFGEMDVMPNGTIILNPQGTSSHYAGEWIQLIDPSTGEVDWSSTGVAATASQWRGVLQPDNYGTLYTDAGVYTGHAGRYNLFSYNRYNGVNDNPPNRPNIVFETVGYNSTPDNARIDTTEYGYQFGRLEGYYQVSAGSPPQAEFHVFDFLPKDNTEQRLLSFHPRLIDGYTYVTSATDNWGWVIRNSSGPRYWAGMSGGRDASNLLSTGASFFLDADSIVTGSQNIIFLGGQNAIDAGFGGARFYMKELPFDGQAAMGFITPTGKILQIESETLLIGDALATSKTNISGRLAIPDQGSNSGVTIGADVTAAFAIGAKLHIYGDGTTQSTTAFKIDKGSPFNTSMRLYDDGTFLVGQDGGQMSLGYATVGAIEASAKFAISSTTQGFLPPRMTTTQKNAISSPAEGLIVYDITLHKGYEYDGSTWQALW